MTVPFNSPLEIGIRSLIVLLKIFPRSLDIQRLVFFDYLTIHSGDVDGPKSLHTPLPLRSGELTIRPKLIERGLLLMRSRGLAEYLAVPEGFEYRATEETNPFLTLLSSQYLLNLQERATWAVDTFGESKLEDIHALEKRFFQDWSTQFQRIEQAGEDII